MQRGAKPVAAAAWSCLRREGGRDRLTIRQSAALVALAVAAAFLVAVAALQLCEDPVRVRSRGDGGRETPPE